MLNTSCSAILMFLSQILMIVPAVGFGLQPFDSGKVVEQQKQTEMQTLEDTPSQRRRDVLSLSSALSTTTLLSTVLPKPAAAATETSTSPVNRLYITQADSAQLENGLLEARVTENVMSPPPYGMEASDIVYPSWFAGVWGVSSTTTDVQAPCGISLFGGNRTYLAAKSEIGKELKYESRFINVNNNLATATNDGDSSSSSSSVIADREFNVKSIARAAMGINSVVDVSLVTPNKFSCILSPDGSPTPVSADLIVLNRRQESIDELNFHCSEVVRQIISPVGSGSNRPPVGTPMPSSSPRSPSLLKEIETASLYTAAVTSSSSSNSKITQIKCRQRSATFLLPSQDDVIAYKAWEYARGRPIDVRYYDVIYTKQR